VNLADLNLEVQELHIIIGKNVKKYRELKGLSQHALSLEIGHASTTLVSQAELGKGKRFNVEHLYKLSKALDVDICKFFVEVHMTLKAATKRGEHPATCREIFSVRPF